MPRHIEISAPFIRNRRNATIALVRSSGVRCGIDAGAEERSTRPTGPSDR